jgi:hypothetical protein
MIASPAFITAHSFKVPALNWWTPGDSNCASAFFLLELKVFMFFSPQPVYAHWVQNFSACCEKHRSFWMLYNFSSGLFRAITRSLILSSNGSY